MDLLLVSLVAFVASFLAFFSGFGLGTTLLPVFAIFFPIETAIAAVAVIHLLNNVFKFFLVGRQADKSIVLRFGLPAIIAAFLGAMALHWLSQQEPLFVYELFSRTYHVSPIKLAIGILMIIFAILDVAPLNRGVIIGRESLLVGGALSGFFGGLSGHQGAIRSAFLIRCGLTKLSFIATGVTIAVLIDAIRLIVYGTTFSSVVLTTSPLLLLSATIFALTGSIIARLMIKKITMKFIQLLVVIMLLVVAVGLIMGLI
ncbi:TSUP family transporter [Bdellovibrionota bacterium]